MSIARVNLLSASPNSKTIDSASQPLATDASDPAGFNQTLASFTKQQQAPQPAPQSPAPASQDKPAPAPTATDAPTQDPQHAQKDLVALLETYLPLASSAGKADKPAGNNSPAAPINGLASIATPPPEETINAAQTQPEWVGLMEDQPGVTTTGLPTQTPSQKAKNPLSDTDIEPDNEAALSQLINLPAQPTVTPQAKAGATVTESTSDSSVVNAGKPQLTTPPAENKPASDDTGQNAFTLPQTGKEATAEQGSQGAQAMPLENSEPGDKPGVSSPGAVGPEKNSPAVMTDTFSVPKLAEQKAEVAAIAKPLNHPDWGKDLGSHIIWMNSKDIQAAEIKLNPLHLGPISVRIDVSQDNQASIQFTAQHSEAKEALESSLPKLREMLNSQQMNLVNVNISQNPGSHHGRQTGQPSPGAFGGQDGHPGTESATAEIIEPENIVSKGLLSLYA